jgi:saccharopine dehydrogenase-like NADP-dependent oxidoreductase
MKDVVVIGAGKIGATVAGLLAATGDYQVTLADRAAETLGSIDQHQRIRVAVADVEDSARLVDLLNGQFAQRGALPSHGRHCRGRPRGPHALPGFDRGRG